MRALPRGKLLLDTSAYIRYIRDGAFSWVAEDAGVVERCVLTAVVAAELYAGARHPDERNRLDSLCRWHRSLGNFSFPDADMWCQAGSLVGRYARLHGPVWMADHFRDVLIALEASNHQATLMTENAQDFSRWQKILRSSGRTLRIHDLRKPREAAEKADAPSTN